MSTLEMSDAPFTVFWILRGESVEVRRRQSSTAPTDSGDAASTCLSFDDVSQLILQSGEDLAPYPPYMEKHLKCVAAYLVAVKEEDKEAGPTPPPPATAAVMGVIAVAWVDLSNTPRMPANAVQGYLQLVLVPKPHRRAGVASRLLSVLLAERDKTSIASGAVSVEMVSKKEGDVSVVVVGPHGEPSLSPSSSAAAGKGVTRKEASGTTAISRPITSWMLHTMSADSVATRAYLRHRLTTRTKAERASQASEPAAEAAPAPTVGSQVDSALETMRAVTALYTKVGFVSRRTLYRYYGGLADGTEMVKQVERSLKTARQ